jgi:microcystin degradation protein MlrC
MRHFYSMALDPADYKIVVVKLGCLFPELRDYAPAHIMAFSPGFGDQRLDRLPYRRLRRPIYPLDHDVVWP